MQIGVVARPHGLRGELKVHLHWGQSTALEQVASVTLAVKESEARYKILEARRAGRGVLLRLEGVTDRDAGEALRGARVMVERTDLPELEEGEYYLSDLLDAEVVAPGGAVLGRVVGLAQYPTVDAVVVELSGGERKEQPLMQPFIEYVDAGQGRIQLATLEGLI